MEAWRREHNLAVSSDQAWQGRQPKGYRCNHSFKEFVAKAKTTKEGRSHLERHHGGHGL